jgi:hypothetical protein
MSKYFGNWEKHDDVRKDFAGYDWSTKQPYPLEGFPKDEQILWAGYETPGYEGYAHVLFTQGGKLFEVYGSHCSCNGLEDQWEPKPVTWAALAMRPRPSIDEDGWHSSDFDDEARAAWWALVDEQVPE